MCDKTASSAKDLESPFLDSIALQAGHEDEGLTTGPQSTPAGPQILVVAADNMPLTDGDYAIHQSDVVEQGKLGPGGRVTFGKIDPKRPFIFAVRDRVCAIRSGAFLNPDDASIQYGGTWFDWALVRDDVNPDKRFWPHYQKEMDRQSRGAVDWFMQHEHITRRPIQVSKPVLLQHGKVIIRATPVRIRVGPFVRYTDHERAVIWIETVTPALVRVRHKLSGTSGESSHYGLTVRAGGRYFAAVEIDGLTPARFFDYTIELAPLPASGPIPIGKKIKEAFPKLTTSVVTAMVKQFTVPSLDKTPWLCFRTLSPNYDERLRFATGSCRWYPTDIDADEKKAWSPDMFEGLGQWVRATPKELWPQFLFFGGDQIYADEIGVDHGGKIARARFAARIPGPADARPLRDKLVDGAWAGRFAHRFHPYTDPEPKLENRVNDSLKQLDALYQEYPVLRAIYKFYPDLDRKKALTKQYQTYRTKRQLGGAKGEAEDERNARIALAAHAKAEPIEIAAEPFRAISFHWTIGARTAAWRNPMSTDFLIHNFALWSLPDFERDLPTVTTQAGITIARKPGAHGHPSAERGVHAADFAEYSYLYQRAWTSSPTVRMLLAHVPTFLMFDDHEVTDDWNFGAEWVRLLHNPKDDYRMWPKTLTDALAAYFMYQGWCNKAPSQWDANDPRISALNDAQRTGTDALPQLRKCIYKACFTSVPKDSPATYQAGLGLEWHYKLPFDPPFLVPDCRSRRMMVPADDKLRDIDHDDRAKAPMSQTIDDKQLAWMRGILVDRWRGGSAAFIAPSTPLLLQKKFSKFMTTPEVAAGAWSRGMDLSGLGAVVFDSSKMGVATDAVLRAFRRSNDLEHMIRDKSWRDLWAIVEDMRKAGSPVKTLVLVSGDVHHSYCMTGNLSGSGRPRPEVAQITCSGFQTKIRATTKSSIAEELSSVVFDVGKRRLVPGFVMKHAGDVPDLALYENAAAVVEVTMRPEVDIVVTYLAGNVAPERQTKHVWKYTSAASYMKNGEPAVLADYRLSQAQPGRQRRTRIA